MRAAAVGFNTASAPIAVGLLDEKLENRNTGEQWYIIFAKPQDLPY